MNVYRVLNASWSIYALRPRMKINRRLEPGPLFKMKWRN